MRVTWLPISLLSTFLCFGQSFSIGVKAGARATDDLSGDATSESKRYVAGPAVQMALPLNLGLEFDALYRREGYRSSFGNFAGSFTNRERTNSWEFPILLKYRVAVPIMKPYVAAGYAAKVLHGSIDMNGITINLLNGQQSFTRSHYNTAWDTSHGIVAAGGVEFKAGALRFSPELRYTRWNNPTISVFGSQGYAFRSADNQLDLLLELSWKFH
jgi:hypothetical protein